MTLSEIEITLEELATRHPNLTGALLTTMLTASGWEDKNIQDALMLFKQRESKKIVAEASTTKLQSEQASAQLPADITFYHPDGTEEELHPIEEASVSKKDEVRKETILEKKFTEETKPQQIAAPLISQETENLQEVELPEQKQTTEVIDKKEVTPVVAELEAPKQEVTISLDALPQLTTSAYEPESLITHETEIKTPQKQNHIPDDLPLIPFESSPHIWSFARYKNVFHANEAIVPEDEIKAIEKNRVHAEAVSSTEVKIENTSKSEPHLAKDVEEEITLERTPMTREDESLVFLAGIMLLAIILILGYMYSNGRL